MLIKILGGIDLAAGFILLFLGIGVNVPHNILLFFGIVLIGKSLLGFLQDFGSWIDLVTGLVLLISIMINVFGVVLILVGIVIVQKGVLSFL